MKKFTIYKEYYKDYRHKTQSEYYISELVYGWGWKSLLHGKYWKEISIKETFFAGPDIAKATVFFETEEEAREYLKNYQEPVYAREVIK